MKKTFQLKVEGKHPDRLLEAIKYDVRKYVKRERNKTLPLEAHYWAFDCRFGADADTAEPIRIDEMNKAMDAIANAGGSQFYVEILARPAVRTPKPDAEADAEVDADDDYE